MKNILFVTDRFSGGGLEARVIDQINVLKKYKIKPFLLSHEINPEYEKHFSATSEALPLLTSKDILSSNDILKSVNIICNFCIKHNIEYIDCNPFWCILPTAIASKTLNIPNSFTLHGVNSGNFIAKEYLTAQSLYNIAMSYGFCETFAVAEYLLDLYPQLINTHIIRNGLDINKIKKKPFGNTHKVAIASRLDEPKSQIIIDFLPKIYSCGSIKHIDIIGAGSHAKSVQDFIINNHYDDKIHFKGWSQNLSEEIYRNNYMIVFGMGRVVLDAIKSGVPAGVLGYGGFAGLVNRHNLINFSKNNLTSWQETTVPLADELNMLFNNPNNYLFNSKNLTIFNREVIWKNYYEIIKQAQQINRPNIEKLHDLLKRYPSANIYNDQNIFLGCVRMLSDGNKPIAPNLFYNIFQNQFDKINELQRRERSLSEQIELLSKNPLNKMVNKLAHGLRKNKNN